MGSFNHLITLFLLLAITLSDGQRTSSFSRSMGVDKKTSSSSSSGLPSLNLGFLAPHTSFGKRDYQRASSSAVNGLTKTKNAKYTFFQNYTFTPSNVHFEMIPMTPSPTAILDILCKDFLKHNVSAIMYMMNFESFGRSTASAQYFLQLAGYMGIPVISWNADNSGLERRASQSALQLQLAPSIEHQAAAMLSILHRYKWHQFSIVTSQIAGHDDFGQAVRERVNEMQDHFKFTILNTIVVTKPSDFNDLVNSESRVMLLYATKGEASDILQMAKELKLTGENFVWVVTQSVIENTQPSSTFPVVSVEDMRSNGISLLGSVSYCPFLVSPYQGMLGVHFDTSIAALTAEIANAAKVFANGVESFTTDLQNQGKLLDTSDMSCDERGKGRWDLGEAFFKHLRNVSIETDGIKPNIEFTTDGDIKWAELKVRGRFKCYYIIDTN